MYLLQSWNWNCYLLPARKSKFAPHFGHFWWALAPSGDEIYAKKPLRRQKGLRKGKDFVKRSWTSAVFLIMQHCCCCQLEHQHQHHASEYSNTVESISIFSSLDIIISAHIHMHSPLYSIVLLLNLGAIRHHPWWGHHPPPIFFRRKSPQQQQQLDVYPQSCCGCSSHHGRLLRCQIAWLWLPSQDAGIPISRHVGTISTTRWSWHVGLGSHGLSDFISNIEPNIEPNDQSNG